MSGHHIHKHQVQSQNLVWSMVFNLAITLAQAIGGWISGSLALLSDALHNFSDVLSLAFSLVAHRLSRRKATVEHTFGLKRAELIAAFVNALTLLIVAGFLIVGAVERLWHPHPIATDWVIWLALLGIAVNGGSVLLLRRDAAHNLNMKSAYLHLLTDMLASVAVLVGGLLMQAYQWFWVDSVLTLSIALYLVWVGADLCWKATKMLMLFTPDHIDLKALVREVHKIEGVGKLHHIHVWHLNEDELHLEAHLDCNHDLTLTQFDALLHQIEKLLYEQFHINHITIQPEFKKADPKDFIVQD